MKLSRTKIARLLKTGNQSRKKRDNKKRQGVKSLGLGATKGFSKDELILLPTNKKVRSATNKPSKPFNLRYKTMKRHQHRMSGGDNLYAHPDGGYYYMGVLLSNDNKRAQDLKDQIDKKIGQGQAINNVSVKQALIDINATTPLPTRAPGAASAAENADEDEYLEVDETLPVGEAATPENIKAFIDEVLTGKLFFLIDVGSIGRLLTFKNSSEYTKLETQATVSSQPVTVSGLSSGMITTVGGGLEDEEGVVGGDPLMEGGLFGTKFKPDTSTDLDSPNLFLKLLKGELLTNDKYYNEKGVDVSSTYGKEKKYLRVKNDMIKVETGATFNGTKFFRCDKLVDFIKNFPADAATNPAAFDAFAAVPKDAIEVKQQFRDALKYLLGYYSVQSDNELKNLQNLNVLNKAKWFFEHTSVEDYYRTTIIERGKKLLKGVNWASKTEPKANEMGKMVYKFNEAKDALTKLVDLYQIKTIKNTEDISTEEGQLFKELANTVLQPSQSISSDTILEDVFFLEKRLRKMNKKGKGGEETENLDLQSAAFNAFNKLNPTPFRVLADTSTGEVKEFLTKGGSFLGIGNGNSLDILFEIVMYITNAIVPLASRLQKGIESKANAAQEALENDVKNKTMAAYTEAAQTIVTAAQHIKELADGESGNTADEAAAKAALLLKGGGALKFDYNEDIGTIKPAFDIINNPTTLPQEATTTELKELVETINTEMKRNPAIQKARIDLTNAIADFEKVIQTGTTPPTGTPAPQPVSLIQDIEKFELTDAPISDDVNTALETVKKDIDDIQVKIEEKRVKIDNNKGTIATTKNNEIQSKIDALNLELQKAKTAAAQPGAQPAAETEEIKAINEQIAALTAEKTTIAATSPEAADIVKLEADIVKYEEMKKTLIARQTPKVQALLNQNIQYVAGELVAKAEALQSAVLGVAATQAPEEMAKAAKVEAQKNIAKQKQRMGQQQQRQVQVLAALGGVPAAIDPNLVENLLKDYMQKREAKASIDAILRDPDTFGQTIDFKVRVPKEQMFAMNAPSGTGLEGWLRSFLTDNVSQEAKNMLADVQVEFNQKKNESTALAQKIINLSNAWNNGTQPIKPEFQAAYADLEAAVKDYDDSLKAYEDKLKTALQAGGGPEFIKAITDKSLEVKDINEDNSLKEILNIIVNNNPKDQADYIKIKEILTEFTTRDYYTKYKETLDGLISNIDNTDKNEFTEGVKFVFENFDNAGEDISVPRQKLKTSEEQLADVQALLAASNISKASEAEAPKAEAPKASVEASSSGTQTDNPQVLTSSSTQTPTTTTTTIPTTTTTTIPTTTPTLTPTPAAKQTPSELAASLQNKIVNTMHTLLALAYRLLFLSNKDYLKLAPLKGGAPTPGADPAAAQTDVAPGAAESPAAAIDPQVIIDAINTAIETCKTKIKDENLKAITENIPAVIDSLTTKTPPDADVVGTLIYNFLQILKSIDVDCITSILTGIKTVTPLPKEIEAIVSIKPDCFIKAIDLLSKAPLDKINNKITITKIVTELMKNPENPDINKILGIAGIGIIEAASAASTIFKFLGTECGKVFVAAFEKMKGTSAAGPGPGPGASASASTSASEADTSASEAVQETTASEADTSALPGSTALPESTAQQGLSKDINDNVKKAIENLEPESTAAPAAEGTSPASKIPESTTNGGANHKKRKTTRRRHSRSSKKHKRSRHKRK